MGWYQESVINVTQNSSTVTGVSTRWVSNARVGEALIGPDGRIYEITAIASDKALTISPAYKGATAAAQAYAVVPVQGYVKRLADQAARVLNSIAVGLEEKVDESELPQAVRETVLEGIAFNVTAAVLASDTVLQALGKLQAQASNKVDKVAGKVLSSNDFTNAERVKLTNIAEQATKNSSDAALRDRSTHSGTQAISTVSGLQAALDEKETPAGALAQMQGFGLGAVTGPAVSDLDAIRAGGMFVGTVSASAAAGLPVAVGHSVLHAPGSTGSAQQFASPITVGANNRRRVWHRQMMANEWSAWREIGFLDSPAFTGTPSAPSLKLGNVASADSSTLDHYEEGTFTPLIEGTTAAGVPTYSARFGRYTRLGNRVSWTCRLTMTSLGGMTGSIRLGGFPFVTANSGGAEASVAVGFYSGISSGAELSGLTGLHRTAATNANLYRISAVSKNAQALAATDITDAFALYASGQYEV